MLSFSYLFAQEKATIKGFVKDETDRGVPYALVVLDSTNRTETNLQGEYTFENIPFGKHSLIVQQDYFNSYQIENLLF